MSNVEIVCVIDRSGSMQLIANDAIGGFNAFLKDQQSQPGEAKLTLVLFDNAYEVLHDRVKLGDVPELNGLTYYPRGGTALYDAIGKSINTLGNNLDNEVNKPDKVIFVILTDGEENSSREFSKEKIAGMIKHQQEKYSWEFIFLAANQDAFEAGSALNISAHNTANFSATGLGVRGAYANISGMTSSYRRQGN
jgi:uncharacterized protein YegL